MYSFGTVLDKHLYSQLSWLQGARFLPELRVVDALLADCRSLVRPSPMCDTLDKRARLGCSCERGWTGGRQARKKLLMWAEIEFFVSPRNREDHDRLREITIARNSSYLTRGRMLSNVWGSLLDSFIDQCRVSFVSLLLLVCIVGIASTSLSCDTLVDSSPYKSAGSARVRCTQVCKADCKHGWWVYMHVHWFCQSKSELVRKANKSVRVRTESVLQSYGRGLVSFYYKCEFELVLLETSSHDVI